MSQGRARSQRLLSSLGASGSKAESILGSDNIAVGKSKLEPKDDLLEQYLAGRTKKEIFEEELVKVREQYAREEGDTGSVEVQVAVLTKKIKYLSDHLKIHRKDFDSRRGLYHWLSQRRRLLKYLHRTDNSRYFQLIEELELKDNIHHNFRTRA